jgi:carbon monoxide dehydrogenase subunit G
MAQQMAQRLAV